MLRWLGVTGLFALQFIVFYAAVFESFRSTWLYTQSGACADVGTGADNCDWTFGNVTVPFAFLFGLATFVGAAI
ncbi:hypothetical protein EDF46_0925 [Frondihabitans sp. PhB188]|nr:hypothetical protein EDF46_0925 [Frondihabitans sp. PhB188]